MKGKKPIPVTTNKDERFDSRKDAAAWLRKNGWPSAFKGNICLAVKKSSVCYGRYWRNA